MRYEDIASYEHMFIRTFQIEGFLSIPKTWLLLRVSLLGYHSLASLLAEIPVLVGGAILPAPAVPASTRISARLKRVGNTVHP